MTDLELFCKEVNAYSGEVGTAKSLQERIDKVKAHGDDPYAAIVNIGVKTKDDPLGDSLQVAIPAAALLADLMIRQRKNAAAIERFRPVIDAINALPPVDELDE